MPKQKEELEAPSILAGQPCPICHAKTLTLTEAEKEIPFFGKCFLFSMDCSSCHYHKADIESSESKGPVKYTLDITSEEDMKIRVIKSGEGSIKIPHVGSVEGGPNSNGYITNVEGVFNRIKKIIEGIKNNEEDPAKRKKAKNLLKKISKILWGEEKSKLIIEDPTGNSCIISEKAVKSNLKK